MESIARTDRLLIRRITANDADFIVQLVNTPSWYRFIGDRDVRSIAAAVEYLENGPLKSYRENGFGSYCLELIETGERIGMCGLHKRESLPHFDLGFALLSQFEGKGYAAEAAEQIIRQAKEELALSTILAITTRENERSMNLLKRLGFHLENEIAIPGDDEPLNCFRLDLHDLSTTENA
jgi:ribosomal-protein-alanine N-acetyltransferase